MPIDLAEILSLLYGKRKLIITICGIATLGAVIITLLKPDYYKAETIFYPASEDLSKPEQIFGLTNIPLDYYGSDTETDRLLSTGRSHQLKDSLIVKYDLLSRYEINPQDPLARLKASRKLSKLLEIKKNKLDAIELSVEDTDPVIAAELANGARNILNRISTDVIRQSQRQIIRGLQGSNESKQIILDTLSSQLERIRSSYQILDPEIQTENLANQISSIQNGIRSSTSKLEVLKTLNIKGKNDSIQKYKLLYEGSVKMMNALNTDTVNLNLKNFAQGRDKLISVSTYFVNLKNQLARDKVRLEQMENAIAVDYPALLLVQAASPPQLKSRPKRSLMVMGTLFGAFVFSILGILFQYSLSTIDWKPK